MITIIHGDDTAASRTYYKGLQKKDAYIFDGEKVTVDDIYQATASHSLFTEEKNIYIENFFSKRKTSKETEAILALLQKPDEQITLVLWESKQLTKKQLDAFPKSIQKSFMLPKSLFTFLDAIKPKNTKSVLTLYHETLKHTEAEMILAMVARQIRILLSLSDAESTEQIDDVKRIAPWQKNKLLAQTHAFSQTELKKLHAALYKLDVKSKTGGLPLPLSQEIDFLLVSI